MGSGGFECHVSVSVIDSFESLILNKMSSNVVYLFADPDRNAFLELPVSDPVDSATPATAVDSAIPATVSVDLAIPAKSEVDTSMIRKSEEIVESIFTKFVPTDVVLCGVSKRPLHFLITLRSCLKNSTNRLFLTSQHVRVFNYNKQNVLLKPK